LSGRASGIAKSADGDVELARTAAALRPTASGDTVVYATKLAIATLGRRVLALEAERLDHELETLVRRTAPSLLEVYGVGIHTAAILLVAAGDNPHRLKSEAAFAHLCGVAPLPASSGKIDRHRLNPGGNRQANHAWWRIVFTRMSGDERTRTYVARRLAEGRSTREVMRALKRYVARELYPHLAHDGTDLERGSGPRMPRRHRLSFERTAGPPLRTRSARMAS
jgi:transposase